MKMTAEEPVVVVYTTTPPNESEHLAKSLLEKHLIACVNIVPVRSLYQWKGESCDDEEHLLVMKTTKPKAEEVIAAIRTLHSYELPEAIVLPVIVGSPPYLDWVRQEVGG